MQNLSSFEIYAFFLNACLIHDIIQLQQSSHQSVFLKTTPKARSPKKKDLITIPRQKKTPVDFSCSSSDPHSKTQFVYLLMYKYALLCFSTANADAQDAH